MAQATKLLARRTHFERELQAKLAQRGYERDEIDDALGKLRERRYLDDAEAARQFVEGKLRKGGFGRNLLRAELVSRGVDDSVVEEVLGELTEGDDLDEAREEAERWTGRRSKPPEPAAVARRLERRGFSARSIATVVREMDEQAEA